MQVNMRSPTCREAKKRCPDLPLILYISNSGALVERMAAVK